MKKSDKYVMITGLLGKKDFKKALDEIERSCLDGSLSEAERLECLGNTFFYKGEQQKAFDAFSEVYENFPDYHVARYHYIIGVKDEKAGRFEDAFNRYRSAIDIESTFVDPYIEMGGLLFKVEDYQGSAKCFEKALEFDPYDLRVFHNLKTVYQTLVKANPDVYAPRLARLEQDYKKLERELDPLPKGHKW